MDGETAYSLVGLGTFAIIAYYTLKSNSIDEIQSKEDKQYQVINGYERELKDALKPLQNDKKATLAKKNELLQKFEAELYLNEIFDRLEIKEIVLDLTHLKMD